MNQQRKTIYSRRRSLLEEGGEGADKISETVKEMLSEVTSVLLDDFANEDTKREHWDLEGLKVGVENQFGIVIDIPEGITGDKLTDLVVHAVKDRFERQKEMMGPLFPDVQKSILLSAIDHYWKEHLQRVDRIREWVNLKAYAQKDPLLEYKRETFVAFEEMNVLIHKDTVEKLMKVQLVTEAREDTSEDEREDVLEAFRPKAPRKMQEERGPMIGDQEPESRNSQQQQMSRAQRRKTEKGKKKKKLF